MERGRKERDQQGLDDRSSGKEGREGFLGEEVLIMNNGRDSDRNSSCRFSQRFPRIKKIFS